jgi:anti-sigma B factor antagonist
MKFEISSKDGATQLSIEGQLDAVSVSDLRPELEKLVVSRPPVVEVDLAQLRMVDSSGIGALVSLYKRVRAQGGTVIIKGVRDQPLAIFRLLRLDKIMLRPQKDTPPTGRKAVRTRG